MTALAKLTVTSMGSQVLTKKSHRNKTKYHKISLKSGLKALSTLHALSSLSATSLKRCPAQHGGVHDVRQVRRRAVRGARQRLGQRLLGAFSRPATCIQDRLSQRIPHRPDAALLCGQHLCFGVVRGKEIPLHAAFHAAFQHVLTCFDMFSHVLTPLQRRVSDCSPPGRRSERSPPSPPGSAGP